jgi:hypothetical protein
MWLTWHHIDPIETQSIQEHPAEAAAIPAVVTVPGSSKQISFSTEKEEDDGKALLLS